MTNQDIRNEAEIEAEKRYPNKGSIFERNQTINSDKQSAFMEGFDFALASPSVEQHYRDKLKGEVLEWISVKKKLPEVGQAVLVCLKSDIVTIGYLKKEGEKTVWQLFGDMSSITELQYDQAHYWMRLPAPQSLNKMDVEKLQSKPCDHIYESSGEYFTIKTCKKCGDTQ